MEKLGPSYGNKIMPNTIEMTCEVCGKHRLVKPYQKDKARFCSLKCHGLSIIGSHQPQEIKEKISSAMKRQYQNNQSQLVGHERRRKISIAAKKRWQDPEFREKITKIMSQPKVKEKRTRANSVAAKRLWQSPEYISKLMRAIHAKPTKPERRLIDIFSRPLPQFQYNGDFSLGILLGGLIPDFVNVNGKKQVIELFGDYFHSPEVIGDDWRRSELGKVMLYNSLGYQCLVIWEHEVNELSEDELVEKVNKSFSKHGRV